MRQFFANLKNNRYLFLITLLYFALSFVNISFALLMMLCMALPLILLFKYKRKVWCQGYCPRAMLFTAFGKIKPYKHTESPKFFTKGAMKWIILIYFMCNLFFIIASTIAVFKGTQEPSSIVRLFVLLPLGSMPQLFNPPTSDWLIHLCYSFYSMMLTTTLLGLFLAMVYKPRTWCSVCPIATISSVYINHTRKEACK